MENSLSIYIGFPGNSDGKESACNVGDLGLIPGLGRFTWKSEWLPTPVFLPGDFHGQRNLAGYSHGVTKSQTQLSDFHKVLYIYLYLYLYGWITLLYSRNKHNIVYQVYFIKIFMKDVMWSYMSAVSSTLPKIILHLILLSSLFPKNLPHHLLM